MLTLLKATAVAISHELDKKSEALSNSSVNPRTAKGKQPIWMQRIEKQMEELYKDVDRLSKLPHLKPGKRIRLSRKYQVNETNVSEVVEICKQKLQALKARKKRYIEAVKRRKQNEDFQHNRKKLFQEILGSSNGPDQTPDEKECESFWRSIWTTDAVENESTNDIIQKVTSYLEGTERQAECVITTEDLKKQLRKTPNWKAPGIDGLHAFWLKKLTNLHARLATLLNECLTQDIHPTFTTGRTVLIQKDKQKGQAASNYRPITCLSTIWKTLTGIITEKMYSHLEHNNLIPTAQKGCVRQTRATKDQLIIDKEVLTDAKKGNRNLSMCWIDFQKAFDMVPHSWLIKMLQTYGVANNLTEFIARSMKSWNVWLFHGRKKLCNIPIKRGIFQGDSLSPLLFIMTLFPLSHVLLDKALGYRLSSSEHRINHLVYVDDIKLFASSEHQLQQLIAIVKQYSEGIGMKFGLDKCKVVHITRGRLQTTSVDVEIDPGQIMETLRDSNASYKYLGVLELNNIKHQEMKDIITKEYLRRVRKILQSQLLGKNKITAINTLAAPVVRYSGGIVKWSQLELADMDRKTRKALTMHRGFAMRSDVSRLYVKRNEGGRGLLSIEDSIRNEEATLLKYRRQCTQPILALPDADSPRKLPEISQSRRERWVNLPLHGQYMRQLDSDTDMGCTFQWLSRGNLTMENEAFICAAQEQALCTRSIASSIYKIASTDKCRLCGSFTESVMHIVAECPKLAQVEYLERHNIVARYIHWKLCQVHAPDNAPPTLRNYKPERAIDTDDVKILWDFNIYTDKKITARRPDILFVDKRSHEGLLIDINCPNDANIRKNEIEKCRKYTELKIELERIWGIHFKIVPIVIGGLGAVTKYLLPNGKLLGLTPQDIFRLQEEVLIATCNIMRKSITQSGLDL